jgi:hypothetical protein
VEKQQIVREVLAANLQWILGADKAEVTPQLDEKVLQRESTSNLFN